MCRFLLKLGAQAYFSDYFTVLATEFQTNAVYHIRNIVLYVEFCSSHHVPEYTDTKVLCGTHWNFIPNLRTHFGKFKQRKIE
jgi:hypothetical protein